MNEPRFGRTADGQFTLSAEQWIPRPRDELFPFFADAGNLETLTPPLLSFEVLTPRPIVMRAGLLIDYRLRIRGFPARWQSEITVWDPPHGFVDEQRRGPYRVWHHEHRLEERDGGTLVRDDVRYAVFGGALVDRLIVRRDVAKIFAFRQRKMDELFPPRAG